MEQDYDNKFEEMKKYIPFLERMIKRLESNRTTSGNPRQAQLAKIRSLRDLLLDKKKRMKMENLLKCEQVLVNLYAKVEQRDCFSELKNDIGTSLGTQNAELDLVRNKLKSVVSHLKDQETLPEMTRASNSEEACTVGSKELALFQRRPNKASISPPRASLNKSKSSPSPTRIGTYSRVLISPEPETNWSREISSDKPLYSRRSPRRTPKKSPRRRLSPHNKKERKTSTSQPQESNELKDLNITLRVPEESLSSLNTKDIVSRIINCNDNDVDIDTLRGLRTQILSELKQTGAKDDISDLILQSYKNKKEKRKKKDEIEEGELSDSESEVIESIYGSLVIVDKEQKSTSATRKSENKTDESRKIQICLMINSEKEKDSESYRSDDNKNLVVDKSGFESFEDSIKDLRNVDIKKDCLSHIDNQEDVSKEVECSKIVNNEGPTTNLPSNAHSSMSVSESSKKSNESKNEKDNRLEFLESHAANLCKTHIAVEKPEEIPTSDNISSRIEVNNSDVNESSKKEEQVEIPLLDIEATANQEVVHEIDILQALKNEILSEKISLDDSETLTPPLHQPKVTKVANMHGMITKKRISIEKYKEKATATSKPRLFPIQTKNIVLNDELLKKQSIKLTEKEYERFNLSNKLAFDESSEDETIGKISPTIEDVYGGLAPKSPDHEDFADTGIKPPIIIPADPIKTNVVSSKADVDMRMSSGFPPSVSTVKSDIKKDSPFTIFEKKNDVSNSESEINSNEKRVPLGDPRVRRELNHLNADASILSSVDRTPRTLINFPPTVTPSMMPNVISKPNPNVMCGITQNSNIISNVITNTISSTGIYEMTPSRQTLDNDDYFQKSHVYTSTFPVSDIYDTNDMVNNDGHNRDTFSRSRNNFENVRNDLPSINNDYQKSPFGEKPSPLFNRLECPQTPIHPFGMSDCPPTPTHSFGLLEAPMTPIPAFGRCDAPVTPVHPFGLGDCPTTTNHPFSGRTETIMSPAHTLGMADFAQNQVTLQTPPSRYTSFQDSRVNRNSNFSKYDDENDCNDYTSDRTSNFYPRNYKYDQTQRNHSDNYRNYGRQQNNSRCNKNSYEQCDSHYNEVPRRESGIGHSMSRNYRSSRQYSTERQGYRSRDYRNKNNSSRNISDDSFSQNNCNREKSVGRNLPDERNLQRDDIDFTSDNVLSVESNAGRSFIIDTSVNRSFQELQVPSFDARRRRASSVGRSLTSEQTSESESANIKNNKCSLISNNNNNFRRARSVGREMAETHKEKNFKDIKAELQSYKHDTFQRSTFDKSQNTKTLITDVRKKVNERDPRLSRRDEYDFRHDKNESRTTKASTPRGYYRDPRLHREYCNDSQKKCYDDTRGSSRADKKHGIVYSADNIAKGTILGSGYGVKNYKIPKLKKVSDETVNQNSNENDKIYKDKTMDESKSKKVKDDTEKIKPIKIKQEKKDSAKRTTRWEKIDKIVPEVEKDPAKTETIKKYNEYKNEEDSVLIIIPDNVEKQIITLSLQSSLSELTEVECEKSSKRKFNKIKEIEYDSDKESFAIISTTSMKESSVDLKNEENRIKEKRNKSHDKNNDILNNGDRKNLVSDLNSDNKDTCNKKVRDCNDPSESKNNTKDLKIEVISNLEKDKEPPLVSEDNNCYSVEHEMFSDNVASDQVIENINALIADLDEDLETSKNNNSRKRFTQEITLENMLDNITCTDDKKPPDPLNTDTIHEERNKPDLIDDKVQNIDLQVSLDVNTVKCLRSEENRWTLKEDLSLQNNPRADISSDATIHRSVVSTTDKEKSSSLLIKEQTQQNEGHMESCSTPDSTIEVNENDQSLKIQEIVPDSTNELNCEMSSDISSTHISHESKANIEIKPQNDNKNDSIGSLLSILKDKSKIKELLTMLEDQSSENYKLKKKLEKLSEIVSDDDDDLPIESNVSGCNSKISNNVKVDDLCEPMNYENVQKEKDLIFFDINRVEKNILGVQGLEHTFKKNEESKDTENEKQTDKEEKGAMHIYENDKKQNDAFYSQNESTKVEPVQSNKKSMKNIKAVKKSKDFKDSSSAEQKCILQSNSANTEKPMKKTSRELKQLQDDIKEMFMHDDFTTNNTGIRMCRLAKLVENKTPMEKDEKNHTDSNLAVLLDKVKQSPEDLSSKIKFQKKKQTKSKVTQKQVLVESENDIEIATEPKVIIKLRPGPKSKTKVFGNHADSDPYIFKSDSFCESNNTTAGERKFQNCSESESESLESSNSFGSTELLAEIKKKTKRKRRSWQAGVIKPKYKKKKVGTIPAQIPSTSKFLNMFSDSILDENCFTDTTYCFKKGVTAYACRFCAYTGNDIVHHYKKQHPHSEIPLSRLSPKVAKAASEQCHGLDFQELRKVPSDKYVCRFCFKEFAKKNNALEAFFWHVVSTHTGEYKTICSECVHVTKCPFNLDIPPPPKEQKGQLIGYVCDTCYYTQVSLENLKSHVINRHDNRETEVFAVNLSVMTKKFVQSFKNSTIEPAPRVLRSTRLNQSAEEGSNKQNSLNEFIDNEKVSSDSEQGLNISEKQKSKRNKIQSQITCENNDDTKEISQNKSSTNIKFDLDQQKCVQDSSNIKVPEVVSNDTCNIVGNVTDINVDFQSSSDDVFDYPHFKVLFTETGTKVYDCCINGVDSHFRTPLLISFKKHVQIKHKEKWDGFCFVCKLIVTSQGDHNFKDCLEHFLDKHMDNFPVVGSVKVNQDKQTNVEEDDKSSKTYLNVRPLSELIPKSEPQLDESPLPIIESVVSLGASADETSQESNRNHTEEKYAEDEYKYEEAQATVIARKNNVVLGIMMNREKLVHIFKCAGRFCSYSTDNAEDALRHAVTHERVGGESSLNCAYCDFDSSKNAVDLVTHVFKFHASSPFVCGHCFYRAAASQLVRAHQARLHENERALIYRSTVSARSNTAENILPREIAVPEYFCNQDSGACQFKTYTLGKFSDHLQTRHEADSEFSCRICSAKLLRISDLVQHMQGHGFRLYQCPWCVHGVNNETELLAHASEKHPNKQPQAYIRIITNNKEGTKAFRVLPLAQFNNRKVATIDVVPNGNRGNPEREAERSIDLEKLIGPTTQMMESMITSGEKEEGDSATENIDGNFIEPMEMFDKEPLDKSPESLVMGLQSSLNNEMNEALAIKTSLAVITPIPPVVEAPNLKKLLIGIKDNKKQTSLLKIEPETSTSEKFNSAVVYCIDSDDESPGHNVIDLSTEDIPSASDKSEKFNSKRVPLTRLYKCGLCRDTVLKNAAGFKRHVTATHYQELDKLTCAHCSFIGERDTLVKHYNSEHSLIQKEVKRYVCGVCDGKYIAFSFVKKHLKEDHKLSKLVVSTKRMQKGELHYVVNEAPAKQPVKRKISDEKNDKGSPAMKMKKFGLQDVDSLPITPILDELVYCALCEFSTKVRLNMVRHLQLHAEQQPVPQTNPVNPVPHLETNEKHFDKMLNLASSSLASRADKSNKADQQPVVNPFIPPETVSRYPKYVPGRQRYTCGAKGCCYISVDENMFKCHWETLHSEANDYRCMHCPPHQHVNTSKQINAVRIIGHLKMHDINLYACSECSYYHNRRQIVDKHIEDFHTSGHVMVVREEGEAGPTAPNLSQTVNATPTMDLKPWQCGLCKFKSMLCPEVVDHCAKMHQSKMQYKCTYCAFRTSNLENITKHQGKTHADKAPDTFYFYYREGSIPDEPDGTPRWQKQCQKSGLSENQVKTEAVEIRETEPSSNSSNTVSPPPPITITAVDLNLVKKDPDAEPHEQHVHDLYETFNPLCEPNGLKYKCPLCEIVSEESKEAMQSHLYEELQYRKWACGFCSYKAFHKNGLKEHMNTEHRQYREPIELSVDSRVEMWITKALDHQFLLIEKNRKNMAKQSFVNPSTVPSTSKLASPAVEPGKGEQCNAENLQNMFGKFGESEGMQFSCPKCNYKVKEETLMRNHLEIELHKIRWCCNSCTQKFQNYHQAQFHCYSAHAGAAARAVEAERDADRRNAWVSALLHAQRLGMTASAPLETTDNLETPEHSALDNSLLVVRYEERVPIPEVENANLARILQNDSDDDEERLVIDELSKEAVDAKQCFICAFKCKELKDFKEHINRHTEIRPYFCPYCDLNGHRKTLLRHLSEMHTGQPVVLMTKGQRAMGPPLHSDTAPASTAVEEDSKLICLICEKSFTDNDAKSHLHDNVRPPFARKGDVVVKCCVCLRLHQNVEAATAHHQDCHPNQSLNYAYYKLQSTKRSVYCCAYCGQSFKFWRDFKVHWKSIHSSLPLQFNKRNMNHRFASGFDVSPINLYNDDESFKRKSESPIEGPAPKMYARKSTSKLPVQSVAKKSTSKLPFTIEIDSNKEEYCHYGSKPSLHDLDNVRTSMSFCNTNISFTFKQLSGVIKIDPIVLVEDITK